MEQANAASYFVDRHRGTEAAERVAFVEAVDGGRSLTYAELADRSDLMADLYARHGIDAEDRVLMLMLDQIEFPVIFWGSLKAGVIPVPVNTLLSTELYDTILRDCRARALFVSPELYPLVEPLVGKLPGLKAVFVTGSSTPNGCLSFADAMRACQPSAPVEACADECAFWLYSSGSTGRPKGVRHVHGSLRATADTYGARVLGIRSDDVVFSAAKLFFAYGLGNAMTFPMAVGATTALLPQRPTPDSVFAVMKAMRPTIFYGVPTLYAALVAALAKGVPDGFERLRRCVSAGEALPAEVGQRWARLTGVDILDGVGSTEMLHIFLSNSPDSLRYGTSGVAVPGYTVRLMGDGGAEVGPGEVGELLVDGPSAAEGYWNQREKTRSTFEGRWTRTGDKYERTEDGRYVYCGRTDDMFKVSGIWVAPFEVEQALVSHPDVLEAAVIASKDEDGLEKPKAFVVLKDRSAGPDLDAVLREHVKERIGKWKYPRWIAFVDDLPKTATGKIQRFRLREMDGAAR